MFTTEIAVADDAFWCILSFFLILEIHFSQNCPSFSILFFLNNSIDCNKSYHPLSLHEFIFTNYYQNRKNSINKDYQNFYSICSNSNEIQYIWKFLPKSRKKSFPPSFPSFDRPSHVTNHTIQTPRTRSRARTIRVSMFHSWNGIRGLFRSCKSLWIGHRRGIWFQKPSQIRPSLRSQFHRGHHSARWEFDGSVGKKKVGEKKKKRKKMPGRWNTRINERAEARRLRRQIVSRAQSTYGRDAADGTRDTRVRSSRRRKWTGRGGLVGVARATGTQRKRGRSVWPLD